MSAVRPSHGQAPDAERLLQARALSPQSPESGLESIRLLGLALLACGTFAGLYLARLYSYDLFHSLVELFSVVIACGVFLFAWNSRGLVANGYLLFVGIAYVSVGAVDLAHTLAYKGMGVFVGFDTNLPTQLWIGARYLEALSLLAAPFFLRERAPRPGPHPRRLRCARRYLLRVSLLLADLPGELRRGPGADPVQGHQRVRHLGAPARGGPAPLATARPVSIATSTCSCLPRSA